MCLRSLRSTYHFKKLQKVSSPQRVPFTVRLNFNLKILKQWDKSQIPVRTKTRRERMEIKIIKEEENKFSVEVK